MHRIVEADVHSLTVHLAGTVHTTEELRELARQAESAMTWWRSLISAGTVCVPMTGIMA